MRPPLHRECGVNREGGPMTGTGGKVKRVRFGPHRRQAVGYIARIVTIPLARSQGLNSIRSTRLALRSFTRYGQFAGSSP